MMRWAALAAACTVAACEHGGVNRLITIDGDTLIFNISLGPLAAGASGMPAGTRAVSRYVFVSFDSAVADAFGRSSTNPPNFMPYPCYSATAPLIVTSGQLSATYQSPNRYLPALPYQVSMRDVCAGLGHSTNLIAQPGHPGNGGGNTVWEFWFDFTGALPGTRYIMGLARYAVQVRGALDVAEMLLTGTVTQPDSLVFIAGDFSPGGKKTRDAFTTSCTSANVIHAVNRANPHFLGSDAASGGGAVDLDQTVCARAGEVWGNLGTLQSPVPQNGDIFATGRPDFGANQYNFFVIWEALPDSTPNYAKPVYRSQIGPLLTPTGAVIKNSYGPFPTAAMTQAQLAVVPGGISRPESVTVTMTDLAPLANATYQVWFTKAGTDSATVATGRFDRLVGGVVVDSSLSTTSFNGDTTTGSVFRFRVDYGPYDAQAGYSAVVLAIAPAGGGAALPSAQMMWADIRKAAGQAATPAAGLTFGTFDNGGAGKVPWAPNGSGEGGVAGLNLTLRARMLPRPPVGYHYRGYLRNTTDTLLPPLLDLGPLTSPFPEYADLTNADVDLSVSSTVNPRSIVEASVRHTAPDNSTLCNFDKLDVRLVPKTIQAGMLSPTLSLTGNNPFPNRSPRCQ
jgi:hypothetical protein